MHGADTHAHARPGVRHRTPLRARTLIAWACTGVAAFAFAGMGIANLARFAPIMDGLARLGYPPYFAAILGSWKLLGAVALLCPGIERVKEWAYAGMFFTLTGAASSHALNHDGASTVWPPLLLLAVVMTSRGLRRQEDPARLASVPEPRGADRHVGH